MQINDTPLKIIATQCCLCEQDAAVIGGGEDFEYHTSPGEFTVKQCLSSAILSLG
jgi:hypothetical protein